MNIATMPHSFAAELRAYPGIGVLVASVSKPTRLQAIAAGIALADCRKLVVISIDRWLAELAAE